MSYAAPAAQVQGVYDRECTRRCRIQILNAALLVARKAFVLLPHPVCLLTFAIDAPFGRFTLKDQNSIWLVDGKTINSQMS